MNTIHKQKILRCLSAAILPTFTFFVFGPLEMIMVNSNEFWFSWKEVLPSALLFFFVSSALLYLIQTLLPKHNWISALLWGLGLCLYYQGNFTFTKYDKLDGSTVDWGQYLLPHFLNLIIWLLFAIVFPLLLLWLQKKRFAFIIGGITGIILGMQTVSLVVSMTTYHSPHQNYYLSTEGMNTVSNKKNIIVFMLDGFEAELMEKVLLNNPQLEEELTGFTFFTQATSPYLYTRESVTHMLTGNELTFQPTLQDSIDQAFSDSTIYDTLGDFNYKTALYVRTEMLSSVIADQITNAYQQPLHIASVHELNKRMYSLVAFRYFPGYLKPFFLIDTASFEALKATQGEGPSMYDSMNPFVSTYFEQNPLILEDSDYSFFKYFYLFGAHAPWNFDENNQIIPKEEQENQNPEKQYYQSIGALKIITNYIRQLKTIGAYDNTTLIILADHGWGHRLNPCYLIKPFHTQAPLARLDSPICLLEDYHPTLLQAITEDDSYTTVFDIDADSPRNSYYYTYECTNDNKAYSRFNKELVIGHPANGQHCVVQSYFASFQPPKYTLNTSLDLTGNAPDNQAYLVSGFYPDAVGTWSYSYFSKMQFDVGTGHENLEVELQIELLHHPPHQLVCKANNQILYDEIIHEPGTITFTVPKEIVKNGILTLDFEFPDSVITESVASPVAFCFKSITLHTTNN